MDQIRIVRQTLINRDWNEKIKQYVRGFMIESYLEDGRQNEPEVFGKSITDPCLGWENTEALVREILPNARRIRWHFIEKGQEIDIEAIKAETPNCLRKPCV